ncbi:hypothetical protein [Chitinibacter sp. GC72]|uniref:hypothetical protein n=1 Tax=Chitinibacter sp. GC72 TaxID=1526917 RepID=UPI0012FC2DA2|nr:hypothetical protein [Chitinibacter sp. GC72]
MKYYLAVCLMFPALLMANEAPTAGAKASAKPAATHGTIKNAPPTQVENLKPGGKLKADPPAHEAAAAPSEPPVVQYVPPKYGSSRPVSQTQQAPLVRQYVPSKAPRRAAATHKTSRNTSHAAANEAVTPGLVRVMPAGSLPAGKVLPNFLSATSAAGSATTAAKPRISWGETVAAKPVASPTPEIYIVRDPELRWQQYSYP